MKAFIRKYWLIFAIALLLAAIVGGSQYAENAHDCEDENASQVQAAPVAKDEPGKAHNAGHQANKPPVWARYVTFPEGVGAWAVMLTLLAIVWQSIETRAAAKAGEIAALATQSSVQAMIDSERPWIVAHMKQSNDPCLLDNGNVRFEWTVKNVGKSPAKLIEAGAMVSLDTLGPPCNEISYKMESLNEQILVPGDSVPFYVFWLIVENGRMRTQVGKSLDDFNDLAIVFGFIRYRSAISAADIYETRFSESSCISGGVCDHFEPTWPVNAEDIRCT